jgi:hypothetical protein
MGTSLQTLASRQAEILKSTEHIYFEVRNRKWGSDLAKREEEIALMEKRCTHILITIHHGIRYRIFFHFF